ncbi:hypothetical protein Shyhy01_18210 [Streptomyces hygroscopicus subsp. hygroscopicus]|nr:hypothetical protein Shyhy01_18210 [Streptomyces hygroscopicus subsp. hygroscopicus]
MSFRLAAYPRRFHGRFIRIGREALRCLLTRRGVTFRSDKEGEAVRLLLGEPSDRRKVAPHPGRTARGGRP